MNEAEWLGCTNPQPMLEFLQSKAGDRKLRLFACACCRRIWNLLFDDLSRRAVEVAERFADGQASEAELRRTHDNTPAIVAAQRAAAEFPGYWDAQNAAYEADAGAAAAATTASLSSAHALAASTASYAVCAVISGYPDWQEESAIEEVGQAGLLRDIIGNPFRSPPGINPIWLRWNDSTVVKLAEGIYDERAFDRLPILADALEEAGCHAADILAHCRHPGPHVRGCWIVDSLTGRK